MQFQGLGPKSSRAGFFSDTSDGTVADRDTTDAETDWTDWEAPQRTGPANRKAEVFPILTSGEQRLSSAGGRVTRAATFVNERARAPKRPSRNGRMSPPAKEDAAPNKRRKDDSEYSEPEPGPRFACPYFKRDPQKYRTHRTCPGPGWQTVHRVKEHLYRRHSQPIYCPRCYRVFPKDAQLAGHLRTEQCSVAAGAPPEGLTGEQKERLKTRGQPHQSEEARWRDMFRVLFPRVAEPDMPSPYHDDVPQGGEPSAFRHELLRRVRRELLASAGGQASVAEERVMRQVADIVCRCETEMLMADSGAAREEREGEEAAEGAEAAPAPSMPSSEYWPSSTAEDESDAPSAGWGSDSNFRPYADGLTTTSGTAVSAASIPAPDDWSREADHDMKETYLMPATDEHGSRPHDADVVDVVNFNFDEWIL